MCMIRSMYTEQFNHHPAQLMLQSGTALVGRPTMGAWALVRTGERVRQPAGFRCAGGREGFPPARVAEIGPADFCRPPTQAFPFRSSGDPVLYLSNPEGVTRELQRSALDGLRDLNEMRRLETGNVEIASRIASYELAFRMQMAAPELADLSKESPSTLEMYGVKEETDEAVFGTNCLLARRLVERGVRFVQLMHGSWDDHANLLKGLKGELRNH